jgi:hypothetical protein
MEIAPRPHGPLAQCLAQEWDVAPLPSPEDEAASPTAEQRNLWIALKQIGAKFRDGHLWMHLITPDEPEHEPVLAVAITEPLLEQVREHSQHPDFSPRLSVSFAGGAVGTVLGITLELPALTEDSELLTLRTVLDPASLNLRPEVELPSEQEQVAVQFLDAATGAPLDRWQLPLDDSMRQVLHRTLFRSFGREGDLTNWPYMALVSLGVTYRL